MSVHRSSSLFPLLVALAPVMFVWSANSAYVRPIDTVGPAITVLVITTAALVLLRRLTADPERAAVSVAVAAIPVLTYGHQMNLLGAEESTLPLKLAVLALNAGLAAAALSWIWRHPTATYLAPATVVAVLFTATTLPGIASGLSFGGPSRTDLDGYAQGGPDVYYIVLDAYARADVLRDVYGFTNTDFLGNLESRGFYVADESYSNYAMTHLSLASSLNGRYLPSIAPHNPAEMDRLIGEAEIVQEFRAHGYAYIFFETPWFGTDEAPLADVTVPWSGGGSAFQETVFRTTLLGSFMPSAPRHEGILQIFDSLPVVAEMAQPTFTLAHVLAPHPPFMFDRDGAVKRYVDDLAAPFDRGAYVEQLEFINARVLAAVDEVVTRSDEPPIIILQADHGPALLIAESQDAAAIRWERMAILNAVLAPASIGLELYPTVTPVNVLRSVSSALLDSGRGLLPDDSFYNWYDPVDSPAVGPDPLELQDVTENLP